MALISCPDCGNQVSDLAPACPKCGRPVATASAQPVAVKKGVGVASGVKIGFGMFVILPILLFFAGCFALLALFSGALTQYQGYKQQTRQQIGQTPTPDVLSEYRRTPRVVPTMGFMPEHR